MHEQLSFDRAPRLRRHAQMLEDRAERSTDPAKARAIARQMRVRAAELEAGDAEYERAAELIHELGEDPPRPVEA